MRLLTIRVEPGYTVSVNGPWINYTAPGGFTSVFNWKTAGADRVEFE
jgi:hypothetical protein